MQNIQECGDGVTGGLTNLGLLDKSIVEEGHRVLLLFVRVTRSVTTLGLLSSRRPRDVEPHFDELVLPRSGLPAFLRAIRLCPITDRKLNCYFVAAGQVGVGDFGVGNFESGSVLDVKSEFSFAELSFAPVPTAEGVFLVLEIGAIPILEDFA